VALTALEKLFDEMEIYDPEDRAEFVKWMLSRNDKSCAFYYKQYEANKKPVVSHIPTTVM